VLIGTGRTCSSHPGNRSFHKDIYESCQDYFDADYKKGVVDRAIRTVHRRGGRFLTKKGDQWVVVTDHDRLERNTRKSFHMARKQRETLAERTREDDDTLPERPPIAAISIDNKKDQVYEQRMIQREASPNARPVQEKGLHVAIYRRSVGAFCIGKIQARAKNLYLLRFDDSRLPPEWVDLDKADCRVFSA
jgi:hypothetical protein